MSKNGKTHFRNLAEFAARFLKCVTILGHYLLTLNVPCTSENCTEINMKLNFYFQISLRCLKKVL